MICPDANKLMMWIDGELDPEEVAALTDHLEGCSSCSAFVKAQKQMESVWRDSWSDPDDSQFFKMRSGFNHKTPWWKTQRSWYIAAALCAAYLGVKIFFVDGAGTSLAEHAIQESTVTTVEVNAEPVFDVSPETVPEEIVTMESEEIEEETEEIDVSLSMVESQDESIEDVSELLDEQVILSGYEVSGGFGAVTGEDFGYSLSEVTLSSDDIVSGQESQTYGIATQAGDISQPISEDAEEAEEMDTLYRSVSSAGGSSSQPGSFADDAHEGGSVCGVVATSGSIGSGGGGVGGMTGGSIVDLGSTRVRADADQMQEDSLNSALSSCPAPVEECMPALSTSSDLSGSYIISIVMETKEETSIQRADWQSLYELVDTMYWENCYLAGEELILIVDIEGKVSGSNVQPGTVIDLPQTAYGNSLIFIQFQ